MTNVEVVRFVYESLSRDDSESTIRYLDPDCVWDWPRWMPDTGAYRGHSGWREGNARWRETWAELAYEVEEVLERDDQVFVMVRYRARAKGSGLPVDELVAHRWEFRAGKIIGMRIFGDAEKARRRFIEDV